MIKRKRFQVFGRVQGVWFRAHTQEEAMRLGLAGFVRNLPDGSVEAVAQGEEKALADFEGWLYVGPRLADVTGVTAEELVVRQEFTGFEIRY